MYEYSMRGPLDLTVDVRSPIPIRRQLTEQLKHAIEGGGIPRDQALPSIRELAGFLGINPNTVARVVEDLKRSGHVEARRGKGIFVAPVAPERPIAWPLRTRSPTSTRPRGVYLMAFSTNVCSIIGGTGCSSVSSSILNSIFNLSSKRICSRAR